MFDSIKDWLDVPTQFKPFERRDGAGDKHFKPVISIDSYPVHEFKLIRNSLGVEVLSSSHYYIDGSHNISILDEVLVDGVWMPIQSIGTYFREGHPDIKVVYV